MRSDPVCVIIFQTLAVIKAMIRLHLDDTLWMCFLHHKGCYFYAPQRVAVRPTLVSVGVPTLEASLAAVDHKQIDTLSATQPKTKCKKSLHSLTTSWLQSLLNIRAT